MNKTAELFPTSDQPEDDPTSFPAIFDNAIGLRKGSFIEIINETALVRISIGDPAYGGLYMVGGDCSSQRFDDSSAALEYALKELGKRRVETGRAIPAAEVAQPSDTSSTESTK